MIEKRVHAVLRFVGLEDKAIITPANVVDEKNQVKGNRERLSFT